MRVVGVAGIAIACIGCGRIRFADHSPAADAQSCVTSSDCDDQNPCTVDSCDAMACAHQPIPDGTTCDDGLGCGTCWAAVCQTRSPLPVHLDFAGRQSTVEDGKGLGTGFTHLIPSTGGSYLPANLDLSAGTLTVTTTEGDWARRSSGTQNDQDNALAVRIDATAPGKLRLAVRLVGPWDLEDDYQNAGVMFGISQDDYVKLVVIHHTTAFGGVENDDPTHAGFHLGIERTTTPGVVEEHNFVYSTTSGFQGVSTLELDLEIDPAGPTSTACYSVDGGPIQVLTTNQAIAPAVPLFTACSYAGLAQTNNDYAAAQAGGDPANSPWHPHFDAFAVLAADTDGDGQTRCNGDVDEPAP